MEGLTLLQAGGVFDQLLSVLHNPDVAFLLLCVGGMGLFFEISSPGGIFPGVLGSLALLLAIIGLSTMPVNFGGVFFIALAFVLLTADLFAPTHGVLTVLGLVSLFFGGTILVNTGGLASSSGVSLWVLLTTVLMIGGFFVFGLTKAIQTRLRPPATGRERLLGAIAEVRASLKPKGMVFIEGQLWSAVSQRGDIPEGSYARIVGISGLTLIVEPHVLAADDQPTATLQR